MTKLEYAKKVISENPELTYKEINQKFGCSLRTIKRAKKRLRQEGNIIDKQIKGSENKTEYTFTCNKRIISKDDLVKYCDIDLTEFEIVKWECNKWEVGAKNKDKEIVVTPLFQVKLILRPRLTNKEYSILDAITEVVNKKEFKKYKDESKETSKNEKALKLTVSDMHVGLDPNPSGKSLFNYHYSKKDFYNNLYHVYTSALKEKKTHGKFDLLLLDDLGDGLDGWNNQTTRGGHQLDQNLSSVDQFKTYVDGKLQLIENLVNADIADKILIRTVTEDNHAGDFSHVANFAIQRVLEQKYSNEQVDFYVIKRFMEHFKYGDHTFILTHGKDSKYMFKGLPLELNDRAIKFINDYINHYKIETKNIHVEKGDLHQLGYRKVKNFDYRNFMSFAPPSAYVQNNHGDSYSGYSIQIVEKFGAITHKDVFFEMKPEVIEFD